MEGLTWYNGIMKLKDRKCIPCEDKNIKPMKPSEAKMMLREIPGWVLEKGSKKISRTYLLKDFKAAMKLVNAVAKIAEKDAHHPDIFIWYNKVRLDLWTHAIGGLSENDFIVAAKINAVSGK
jgi:4a-hydroxytetrahydrobiopterin dehydratase